MRCWRAVVLVLLPGLVMPGRARADEKKSVEVEIWTIRATTKDDKISPELKELAELLKKQFKFTGFKLEKKSSGKVEIGKSYSTELLGGYKASVTPTKWEEKEKKITFKVVVTKGSGKDEKNVLTSTVTVDVGKFQLFGGDWQMDGGDTLIMAVRGR